MGYWNTTNYVLRNNRFCLLGCGRCINGRVPVGLGREMEMVGMVTGPRANRVFEQIVFVQVLLFVLGFRSHFVNFVRGNRQLVVYGGSSMHDNDNA